nr:Stp1/IreP family PP2C-type Ser/Thr phosphatase [uncultured Agathobaculum sp.]
MEYFGITDKGRVRPTNQDIYRLEVRPEKESAFVLVCDGMGGANAGNVASRFAADSFLADAAGALDSAPDEITRHKTMLHALEKANDTVFGLAGRQPEFRGMGTTLVGAFVQGRKASILNVGDSRAYLFDGETLRQVSEDHSYVEEMRRLGRISAEDARTHPQKNLITRAVGVDATVDGDLFEVELAETDILLLCSDGLTGMVEDEKIAEVLAKAGTLEDKGRELLTLALEGGGRDNITVALFTRGAKQEA